MAGFVYVLTNPAMPGLVKIGFTTGEPAERARDLSAATGVPVPFYVSAVVRHEAPYELEQAVHSNFAAYRVNPAREFFRVTPERAAEEIAHIADSEAFFLDVMLRQWNRAPLQWRERFLEEVRA